jgi:hypothetical protein
LLSFGETVYVRPLSYHALRWRDGLDIRLRRLAAEGLEGRALMLEAWRNPNLDDDERRAVKEAASEILALAPLAESLVVRTWAWIITAPTPELPFSDEAADIEPPAWTRRLDPDDLIKLFAEDVEVNRRRTQRLAQAFPPDADVAPSRLTVAGFVSAYADGHNLDAEVVMRRWSIGKVYVSALSAGQLQRESFARADDRAKRTRPA